jgi:phosphate transport system substrate-binding protein
MDGETIRRDTFPRPSAPARCPKEEVSVKTPARFAAVLSLVALVSAGVAQANEAVKVDPALPDYQKVEGIRGNLSSIGSDTMNNLMTLWGEGFKKLYPGVNLQVEGKGSSTAPPALIEGTAQLGPMSRDMKAEEMDAIEKKHGFKPTRLRTCLDALAVYVHKDNPLQSLTMAEVDAIFSKTRKHGHPEDLTTWGQLGLTGEWARKPLSLYGRNSASGTYGYFKEHALKKGDFKDTVKEQPGSASVVQGIAEDKYGIGYSGIGYVTSGVRALSLADKQGGQPVHGDSESLLAGTYPLGRYLNLYIVKEPGKPLDPLRREFVRYIFSKQGQEVVVKDGYFPLSAKVAEHELKRIEADAALAGN